MTIEDFLDKLNEELEWETQLQMDTDIKDTDEWDSLSAMVLISFIKEEFDVSLSSDDLSQITTLNSLVDKVGPEKFED